MKFLDFVLLAIFISVSSSVIMALGFNFVGYNMDGLSHYEPIEKIGDVFIVRNGDGTYEIKCDLDDTKEDPTCKMNKYIAERQLQERKVGEVNLNIAENDFLRAISMFRTVFVNGLLLPGSLVTDFLSSSCTTVDECDANDRLRVLALLINLLMSILYLIAFIQLLSGRNLEDLR